MQVKERNECESGSASDASLPVHRMRVRKPLSLRSSGVAAGKFQNL